METVFDHEPTQEELLILFGCQEAIDDYKERPGDQDSQYVRIAGLYLLRDQARIAGEYMDRIEDKEYRASFKTFDLDAL